MTADIREATPFEQAADPVLATHPWIYTTGGCRWFMRTREAAVRFALGLRPNEPIPPEYEQGEET